MNSRIFSIVMVFLGPGVVLPCAANIPIAVTMGQKSVDPKLLPFVALSFTQARGPGMPIQQIVFEDLETHKEVSAMLSKTFSDDVDYISVRDNKDRLHSQFILRMKAGWYRIKRVEYNLLMSGSVGSYTIDFTQSGEFVFKVVPDAVNYCGSLVIEPVASPTPYVPGSAVNGSYHREGKVNISVERTQALDAKWAAEVIPALRTLPSVSTLLVQKKS